MVETRASAQGKPLKKVGAYDTDAYYAEKDEGYGDVGVDQEVDAGRTQADNREGDPDFKVTADEDRAATREAQQEVGADVPLRDDIADLKASAEAIQPAETRNRDDGGNIDIVPTSREEVEEQEVMVTPDE